MLYASAASRPWKGWYSLAAWRRRRAAQLEAHPLCQRCERIGQVVPATVADHVEPHRGDHDKFWHGLLQSLCKPCHDRDKQREENGGRAIAAVGADGWPI
ncbi:MULTISPECIES: HNH endonuclease [Methylobacterium]|uniref:HNH endonuclease n=1 Tax=Methylobacterium jeotgali TaxID=381630 RepID=A0ABQ4T1G0_9HYPH|nr:MULTISPECIES: HNH endonuclease [Methylobacterium]PIU08196.1 MAG: HNH endonuclease [Methylobacterium sp. CG09_land_8_20_14_0_10_71_15]PIU15706.1 MAG: HNH endonuclease [Methylobacterium sp. CG08_land_8_20_14_0_20_71_15]GBU17231.1 HNH endonuclease [Methylobacterium sp.]GJE07854.1 hypothetical protein AOPFMNJM_3186 [Methylobacterium jeotgali]